jgi:transposase
MNKRDLWEIYRRWQGRQNLSQIAEGQGRDRKTVRKYLELFGVAGFELQAPAVEQQRFYELADGMLPARVRQRGPTWGRLGEHAEELRQLINRTQEPLKPKTAFLVVKSKYELGASYETFKRFARHEGLSCRERRRMIRIELPPGWETQLDYGHMGTLRDPTSEKDRGVWAFCGVLAHSRLPHFEFVRKQNQSEFASSFVNMVHGYGGCTEWISIDNLKAGVIKPDLWDPRLNRSLAEAAEHYGVFVNPCRIGRSTDKGKIERMVPVARELFRMLKELHPCAGLAELNERALAWCREVYGRKEHGTTGVAPMDAFAVEREKLKPLPAERFQVAVWKKATVHSGDQFLTFMKRRFALPAEWRGKVVWARYAPPLVQLYDEELLIREYLLRPGVNRYWHPEDFPLEVREMMNGGYPAWLMQKAAEYGEAAATLVQSVLRPHAYLNARRARGMLDVMTDHHNRPYFEEVCLRARRRSVSLPATLRRMLEAAEKHPLWQHELPRSATGTQMIRDIRYYIDSEEVRHGATARTGAADETAEDARDVAGA